jgi:hypothetical protein
MASDRPFRDKLFNSKPSDIEESENWFRNSVGSLGINNPGALFSNPNAKLTSRVEMGKMYLFYYDPKMKDVLPYYDTLPLIFPFSYSYNSILGINFHYLPPELRAALMDELYNISAQNRYNKDVILRLSWALLKNMSQFSLVQPCVKKYLNDRFASLFLEIPSDQWDDALTLPFERFVKADKYTVWRDSIGYSKKRK